ncbi:gamma-secretase-activating protein isoform X1 [Varanus komodoensis]|uniref:gamma-secretase-activating protein isoform X1 n=1 Tax=Varanus komodoensis TaxID=61221 RepID=UPI001CF7B62B|nr:gamma-secretase-activating protein isoform X1 [Varanus komodoensis]
MLLQLSAQFDPRRDVAPWLSQQAAGDLSADTLGNNFETLHTVNVERNGNVLYTWKGNQGHTFIGLFDPRNQKNQHIYTFEKDLHVISCSVNHEKTLLAVTFLQPRKEERINLLFQPVSKCLTLLVEIHPVNNEKVLKAVDSCIKVQFLYPVAETSTFPESCLLLFSEDKYIEKFDIKVVREGHRVVIENSNRLKRERIADDFIWVQWDMLEQRLFYIVPKESGDTLNCIQFYPDKNFKLILEAPLEISLDDIGLKPVNLDYSYDQDQEIVPKPLNVQVFTSETGTFCVCYSLVPASPEEVAYSVSFLHKGYSKTFTIRLERMDTLEMKDLTFLNLGYYVAVYLPGHFLHLLNTWHPDLMCYNFFLTGEEAKINRLHASSILSPIKSMVWDRSTGKVFTVAINKQALLQFLWNIKSDSGRLAALHCLLLHAGRTMELETQIIEWISENMSTCFTFDPIQEFIIAALYWRMCLEAINLDKLLPYTSLLYWNEDIPGITCRTHIISLPVLKVQHCRGFWEKLNLSLECVKCAEPHLHFNCKELKQEWDKLLLDETTEERTTDMKNIFVHAKRVISGLKTWKAEERLVPLFQDDDYQQQLLTGLMVAQLKDHFMRHLQYVGKKKIEQIAVDYVSKLLDLICWIMENVWKKYSLDSWAFSLRQQRKSNEMVVFHIMCQILQAANGMCVPLPPGFHTLHVGLGVRCLPLHTLLHYIDHGVLRLTEKYVIMLLKELDNTGKNEKLKLSILTRLPEAIGRKVCQMCNHPASSNTVARNYVKLLLEKHRNKQHRMLVVDKLSTRIEFLPLNYLVNMLVEAECQGLMASMEQEIMNARSVEELALKHTTMLLGL